MIFLLLLLKPWKKRGRGKRKKGKRGERGDSIFPIIPDPNLDPTLEVGRVKKIHNGAARRPPNASYRKSKKNLPVF
jgi:hypothetical protein